jgi:hypothetical protein
MNKKYLFTVITIGFISFYDSPLTFAQSKEQLDAMKKIRTDAMKKVGYRTTEELPNFIKKLKLIKIGSDTEDDVVNHIGEPSKKIVLFGRKVWKYDFISSGNQPSIVDCRIEYDLNQKVSYIAVTKGGMEGFDMLYSQGNPLLGPNADSSGSASNIIPSNASPEPVAPASPKEGQIYFNSTDKHFYGWNGTEWKQLD